MMPDQSTCVPSSKPVAADLLEVADALDEIAGLAFDLHEVADLAGYGFRALPAASAHVGPIDPEGDYLRGEIQPLDRYTADAREAWGRFNELAGRTRGALEALSNRSPDLEAVATNPPDGDTDADTDTDTDAGSPGSRRPFGALPDTLDQLHAAVAPFASWAPADPWALAQTLRALEADARTPCAEEEADADWDAPAHPIAERKRIALDQWGAVIGALRRLREVATEIEAWNVEDVAVRIRSMQRPAMGRAPKCTETQVVVGVSDGR